MYNWKSCTLGGVEITSLRLNGNLVWELKHSQDLSDLYYTIVPSNFPVLEEDFAPLIDSISKLTLNDFISLQDYMTEEVLPENALTPDKQGLLVILSKKGTPAYKVYDDVLLNKYTVLNDLYAGIPGVIENTYDIEPIKNFENVDFNVWVSIEGLLLIGDKFIIMDKK